VKGADQCPCCASRRWTDVEAPSPKGFYARVIRVCANCKTLWEPFDPVETIDPDDRYASFKDPCNNCAFRKGSPEQEDKEEWAKTMASLKGGNRFYCHKGVPIDINNDHGFAYPGGGQETRKMRLCRGYLNAIVGPMFREMREAAQ